MVSVPFQTILVALDESAASEKAFAEAKALAHLLSAKLVLVHILNPQSHRAPQPLYSAVQSEQVLADKAWREQYERAWRDFATDCDALLKAKADEAIALGIETDFLQLTGSPGSTICEVARTANASLLVVGSHQRRGMAEIMLGSTSNYITHYAPCSVLVAYANSEAEAPEQRSTAPREVVEKTSVSA